MIFYSRQIWYLESKDFIDLLQRFDHLRIFDKIWHYSALQIGETILYEYLNTLVIIYLFIHSSYKMYLFCIAI